MNQSPSIDLFATLSLTEIVRAAWSRRLSIIAVAMLLSMMAVGVLMILPNRYVSNAQMLVRLGPGAVSMDPNDGTQQNRFSSGKSSFAGQLHRGVVAK